MDSVATERRQCARIEEAVCVWLTFARDRAAYATLTTDLGSHGAKFCASRRVRVGERVTMDIQLPSTSIGCEARVCWEQLTADGQCCFGVRFIGLLGHQRDHLERHLHESQAVSSNH